MAAARPFYKKLLIAAIVMFILAVSFMLSDLYYKVCNIEHLLSHEKCPHAHK